MKIAQKVRSIMRFAVKICVYQRCMYTHQPGNIEVGWPDVITGGDVILNVHSTEKKPG